MRNLRRRAHRHATPAESVLGVAHLAAIRAEILHERRLGGRNPQTGIGIDRQSLQGSRGLYGRGIAKMMKGDVAASNADFEVAREIKPTIADEFASAGVKTKPAAMN